MRSSVPSPSILRRDTGAANIGTSSGNDLQTELDLKATITYVDGQIASIISSAPGALDTLNELAAALGDDENFASTMTTALAGKMSLTGGEFTGEVVFSNGTALRWKDSGGTQHNIVRVLSDNNIYIGNQSLDDLYYEVGTGKFGYLRSNSTVRLNWNDSGVQFGSSNARVNSIIGVGDTSSDDTKELVTKEYVDGIAGLAPLASETASNVSSIDIVLPSGYDLYVIELLGITCASDSGALYLRTSTDGGTTFDDTAGTDYFWQALEAASTSVNGAKGDFDGKIQLHRSTAVLGNDTGEHFNATLKIRKPGDATLKTVIRCDYEFISVNVDGIVGSVMGFRDAAEDVDTIRIYGDSNLSGTVNIYGVKSP